MQFIVGKRFSCPHAIDPFLVKIRASSFVVHRQRLNTNKNKYSWLLSVLLCLTLSLTQENLAQSVQFCRYSKPMRATVAVAALPHVVWSQVYVCVREMRMKPCEFYFYCNVSLL